MSQFTRFARNLRKYLGHIFFVYTEASLAVISLAGLLVELSCYLVVDEFWAPFALVGVGFFTLAFIANIRYIVREERKWMTATRIFN